MHVVPDGTTVRHVRGAGIYLKLEGASTEKFIPHNPECAKAFAAEQARLASERSKAAPGKVYPPFGWTTSARHYTANGPAATSFVASFPCPSNPASYNGEILFAFIALAMGPNATIPQGQTIIQPAAQWGKSENGGGNFWGISSWFTDANGSAVVTDLKQYLTPGENIAASMVQQSTPNVWVFGATSARSKLSCSLKAQIEGPVTNMYAAFAIYESDGYCPTLPEGNPYTMTYSGITVKSATGVIQPNWIPHAEDVCSETAQIISPSSVQFGWVSKGW